MRRPLCWWRSENLLYGLLLQQWTLEQMFYSWKRDWKTCHRLFYLKIKAAHTTKTLKYEQCTNIRVMWGVPNGSGPCRSMQIHKRLWRERNFRRRLFRRGKLSLRTFCREATSSWEHFAVWETRCKENFPCEHFAVGLFTVRFLFVWNFFLTDISLSDIFP